VCAVCLGTKGYDVNPREIDLTGQDLRAIDLSDRDLSGATLVRVNLEGTQTRPETAEGVDLSEAMLRGANLENWNLRRATLRRADLAGAVLTRTVLDGADLSGASLIGANLERASLDGAILAGADLTGADLSEAGLEGARLDAAILTDANLRDADLSGANPEAARSLQGARLVGDNGISDAQIHACKSLGADVDITADDVAARIRKQRFSRTRVWDYKGLLYQRRRNERDRHMTALQDRASSLSTDQLIAFVRAREELAWAIDAERYVGGLRNEITPEDVDELAAHLVAWLDLRGFVVAPKELNATQVLETT
jgi:uncharacterized protein YjbI with pentapeptide repeats